MSQSCLQMLAALGFLFTSISLARLSFRLPGFLTPVAHFGTLTIELQASIHV